MRQIFLSEMAGFQAPRGGWFWALNDIFDQHLSDCAAEVKAACDELLKKHQIASTQ